MTRNYARRRLAYPLVDVIVVVGHIDEIPGIEKMEQFKGLKLLENIEMTFWFSKTNGVTAIAFPDKSLSGEAYYCVESPCLFNAHEVHCPAGTR